MNNTILLRKIIIAICIAVPLIVTALILLPSELRPNGENTKFLTSVNASINSLTATLLIIALIAVKQKQLELHKNLMLSAIGLGAIFLICYVIYHFTNESVKFGDVNHDKNISVEELSLIGNTRLLYLLLLLSHVVLSIIVLPFVLFAALRALEGDYVKHKKIVRFAYPIWLYISISGVLVYWMIKPYYV